MKTVLFLLFSIFIVRQVFATSAVLNNLEASLDPQSIYQLQSKWRDPENQELLLKKFSGQKVIIAMVYTSCAHACPMTISKIQSIEKALGAQTDYKVVLASFDVKNDTPTRLKAYAQSRKLDAARWIFLSASDAKESTARELAVVLGISYKAIGGGDFSHSNVISYLDENGVVRARLEGLSSEIAPFVAIMKASLKASLKDR